MVEPMQQLCSVSQTLTEHIVFYGTTGSGKSSLVKSLVEMDLECDAKEPERREKATTRLGTTTDDDLEKLVHTFYCGNPGSGESRLINSLLERDLKCDAKEPERREKATVRVVVCGITGYGKTSLLRRLKFDEVCSIVISGSPGVGKTTLCLNAVQGNPIKRDLVKPSTPTDDDATCSSPATTHNMQYLCNVLKYWKQEIDPALAFLWEDECPPKRPKPRKIFPATTNHLQNVVLHKRFLDTPGFVCPEDMPPNSLKLISGVYGSDRGNNSIQVLKMEHSALQGPNSQWNLEVKYKVRERKAFAKRWVNIWNFYPDAKVELKRNEIALTISSPNEDHEFAVFGTPGTEDKKRMQMGIFGGKPKQGKHWQIFVTLFDDTMMAFERVCEREERKGRQLLTTLAGLFVANSDEDIKIDMTGLEDGWEIIGSHFMTIKSKEAWNSPENSTDFPYCVFEITHVDKTKQTFFCGIQASHLNDTAETELLALFEQEEENEENLNSQNFIPPPELSITAVDNFIEALEKALAPTVYELDKLTDARNGWESLARALALEPLAPRERFKKPNISFTGGGKKGSLLDLLLHWKQEQTEAFVSFLMLVFFVGCLTGTRFVSPHVLKLGKLKVVPC